MTKQSIKTEANIKRNVYSQYGEDWIIRELLARLEKAGVQLHRWACEFGAWDGLHLSNTARLIREEGFRAVLIEGDARRVELLKRNFPSPDVLKVCSFVTPRGATSLDQILPSTAIPLNFDFLSIDIDGQDYYILHYLNSYKPKLICIEFNPTIPNEIQFVQEDDPKIKQGSSAKAIMGLGELKGYVAVAATHCNLFLLSKEYASRIGGNWPSIDELVPHGKEGQFIFSGYDGTILSNKPTIELGWHGSFPLEQIQILPKLIRKYSEDYNRLESLTFRLWDFLIRPAKLMRARRKAYAILGYKPKASARD